MVSIARVTHKIYEQVPHALHSGWVSRSEAFFTSVGKAAGYALKELQQNGLAPRDSDSHPFSDPMRIKTEIVRQARQWGSADVFGEVVATGTVNDLYCIEILEVN